MTGKGPLLALVALVSVLTIVVLVVDDSVEDSQSDCVREAATEFARSLPGYFTPEQIVEQAETFCEVNREFEARGQDRENRVHDLINNR